MNYHPSRLLTIHALPTPGWRLQYSVYAMARVVNRAGPDLIDVIDQLESLTVWRLRYTTAHVRSLQSLAPLIYYSFHPRYYHENKYDPIVLFDG